METQRARQSKKSPLFNSGIFGNRKATGLAKKAAKKGSGTLRLNERHLRDSFQSKTMLSKTGPLKAKGGQKPLTNKVVDAGNERTSRAKPSTGEAN